MLFIKKIIYSIWRTLPLDEGQRRKMKNLLYTKLPFVFKSTLGYQSWQATKELEELLKTEVKTQVFPVKKHTKTIEFKLPVRYIAFYLPQFHPIAENNEWWGDGFTEWTNVKPAEPQFVDHYQPRIPGDLGYYDLRDVEVQKEQIELAKLYGIGAFCFYFYWFAGKRLLEEPILNYLQDKDLDFPFCLCWANENWSRRWDGLENDILIAQKHSPEDDLAFIEYLSQYLKDSRYIRINGKPLLLVYRPSLLPDPVETVKRWRQWCKENGIGEIYIAYTQSFESNDPREYGFDAAVEFPPNNSVPPVITGKMIGRQDDFVGNVFDWNIFNFRSTNYQQADYKLYRSVNPMWDNTARKKANGNIFHGSSPSKYQKWLRKAVANTLKYSDDNDENIVFVNAWNEWAEGAYLEPDQRYGYAYLEATRQAMLISDLQQNGNISESQSCKPLAIVIHAFYPEVLKELLVYISAIETPCKLYVTTVGEKEKDVASILEAFGGQSLLKVVENRGRDVLPFLEIMPEVLKGGHDTLLKLHTKKSTHRVDGAKWRDDLYSKLLSSQDVPKYLEAFKNNSKLGMIGPQGHVLGMENYLGSNWYKVVRLSHRLGLETHEMLNSIFVAGTMFYVKVEALRSLLDLAITKEDFEDEAGQVDGTMAHAMERAFSLTMWSQGYTIKDTSLQDMAGVSTDYEFARDIDDISADELSSV